MDTLVQQRSTRLARAGDFWALIKFRQTALLLVTGICSYTLTQGVPFDPFDGLWMAVALLFSIAGCTALNMLLDRDIDANMERTAGRPLPAGYVRPGEAAIFGGLLSVSGLLLAFTLDLAFGLVVSAGFAIDLLVYTAWLKRRTPLSIIFGGVSGGMPVLAGRVLALGKLDLIGVVLASSVLLWIPSHILTLAIRYAGDYRRAGVPVWPNVFGHRPTQFFIAAATLLNTLILTCAGLMLRVHWAAFVSLASMSLGLFTLSALQLVAPTEQRNWVLFKAASLYMLTSSLLLTVGSLV
ncbi:MAG: protoheme IX farnesyltransferase [Anaerolineae bacterium]|jgi:protoheme IX farnesyltransferase